jgi:transcriptional regulator with XRE-family HTH domain
MADVQIGKQIKRILQQKNLTLEFVGLSTGFTKTYISLIVSRKKLPRIATLSKIAKVLDVDIGAFFNQKKAENGITLVRREANSVPRWNCLRIFI